MKSERLIFPEGVRLMSADVCAELGLPDQTSKMSEEELARIANADIRAGYVVKKNVEKPGFTTFVKANIHAPDIWRAFVELVKRLLPAEAYPILVYDEGRPWRGPLASTASILNVASEFNDAIANDCFIAFEIIAYPKGKLEEVFIAEMKYLQIWTNKTQLLVSTMKDLQVPRTNELQFIDQFPRMRPTQFDTESCQPLGEVIVETLKERLEILDAGAQRSRRFGSF